MSPTPASFSNGSRARRPSPTGPACGPLGFSQLVVQKWASHLIQPARHAHASSLGPTGCTRTGPDAASSSSGSQGPATSNGRAGGCGTPGPSNRCARFGGRRLPANTERGRECAPKPTQPKGQRLTSLPGPSSRSRSTTDSPLAMQRPQENATSGRPERKQACLEAPAYPPPATSVTLTEWKPLSLVATQVAAAAERHTRLTH